MRHLLYVNSSPRGEHSESRRIADSFLTSYREQRPGAVIDSLDLWSDSLPVYGGKGVEAKMDVFAGRTPSGDAAEAWAAARALFERFNASDDYLFTVPMWNHSVPWVLKHFIDTVSQPGMVFGFDPEEGYTGLLHNKRAVVISKGGQRPTDGRELADRDRGERGILPDVLPPGSYRLNPYGYDVELVAATEIKPGYVGVLRRLLGRKNASMFANGSAQCPSKPSDTRMSSGPYRRRAGTTTSSTHAR